MIEAYAEDEKNNNLSADAMRDRIAQRKRELAEKKAKEEQEAMGMKIYNYITLRC
jgi:hypothetical protein